MASGDGYLAVELLLSQAERQVDHLAARLAKSVLGVLAHKVHALHRLLPLDPHLTARVLHLNYKVQIRELIRLQHASPQLIDYVDCRVGAHLLFCQSGV